MVLIVKLQVVVNSLVVMVRLRLVVEFEQRKNELGEIKKAKQGTD